MFDIVYIPSWHLWPPISLLTCTCIPLWVFSVRVRASPYGIFGRFEDEWSLMGFLAVSKTSEALWGFHAVSQTSEALWVFLTVSWWVTPFGIFSSFRSDGHLLSFWVHSRRLDHYVCVWPFEYLFIYLSIYLFIPYSLIYLNIYLFVYLFMCLCF